MKAILLNTPGSVENLEYHDIAIPEINSNEVLVKVKYISINPVDVKSREGKGMYGILKQYKPLILGWDISGVVEASNSDDFAVGDRVFGMINFPGQGKAYAQYVAAPANQLAKIPENIGFEEASAATLVALTAWQALVLNGKVKKDQKVLIHAASGGVGHIAVQIAKYLGAEVTGTSSSKNKAFVLGLGADYHIDYQDYDWETHGKSFDFVLDTIGGDNINHSLAVTKKGGKIISIPSALSEEITEKANALGVNGYFILVESNGEHMQKIAELLENGMIKPYVSQKFAFDQMKAAHLSQESGRTVGKIIIEL